METDACPIPPDEPLRCGQSPLLRYWWLLRVIGRAIRRAASPGDAGSGMWSTNDDAYDVRHDDGV